MGLMGADGLNGLDEIGNYAGFQEHSDLRNLMATEGFPMANIAGCWVASKSMIDEWRRLKIDLYLIKNACPEK